MDFSKDPEASLPARPHAWRKARHEADTRRHVPPYYERLKLPFGHDMLLRCDDCRKLVVYTAMQAHHGQTPCCGTRRVREVRHLTLWEWITIKLGIRDFPYRKEFLAEFGRVRQLTPIAADAPTEVPRGE